MTNRYVFDLAFEYTYNDATRRVKMIVGVISTTTAQAFKKAEDVSIDVMASYPTAKSQYLNLLKVIERGEE